MTVASEGAGGLVPADLQPVAVGTDVVGVMDRPGAEPQHLAFQFTEEAKTLDGGEGGHGQRILPTGWKVLAFGSRKRLYRVEFTSNERIEQ